MNEQELLRKTFAKIHASDSVEKEILAMKGQKKFNPVRIAAAAAVCACLLVGSAFAADAATSGEFFKKIQTVFGVQEIHTVTFDDDSSISSISWTEVSTDVDLNLPEGAVNWVTLGTEAGAYLTEDGRVMLREAGTEDRDVTEEWAQGGTFTAGGVTFTVAAMSDKSGDMMYYCIVDDRANMDAEDALISGGLLFDPGRCDLSELGDLGDLEGITFNLEDFCIEEAGENFAVYSFQGGLFPETEK